MSKHYKKAIDILENASADDCRRILVAIAKSHPSMLVKEVVGFADSIENQINKEYRAKGKVPAIKLSRSLKGLDLKSAKYFVEELCE